MATTVSLGLVLADAVLAGREHSRSVEARARIAGAVVRRIVLSKDPDSPLEDGQVRRAFELIGHTTAVDGVEAPLVIPSESLEAASAAFLEGFQQPSTAGR